MRINDYLNSLNAKSDSLFLQIVGPFFDESVALKEPVIFVDGGVQYRKRNIGFSVGDGDSSSVPLDQKLNAEKDFSDLSFVLKRIPENLQKIYLLGFLGHRQDHQLMNLAEVHRFLKTKVNVPTRAQFDQSLFAVSKGNWKFDIHGIFSLFSFEEITLSLSGACKYRLGPNEKFQQLSSQGLSNVGHGEIQLTVTSPLFIFAQAPLLLSEF